MNEKYQVTVEIVITETVVIKAKDQDSAIEKVRKKIWDKFFPCNINRFLVSKIP